MLSPDGEDYDTWSVEALRERVKELASRLNENKLLYDPSKPPMAILETYLILPKPSFQLILTILSQYSKAKPAVPKKKNKGPIRPFDPSKYSTRLVALKISYVGKRYNGFEFHANNKTPLPTVEEELWKALVKTKLIFKTEADGVGNWDGCDYTKAGRTDKGVSAFGQVIGIRVRSLRPLKEETQGAESETGTANSKPPVQPAQSEPSQPSDRGAMERPWEYEPKPFHHIHDEISYPRLLNRVLPADICVLAWCPSPPEGFSARFSCKMRHYKYYFTQPCTLLNPNPEGLQRKTDGRQERIGWLDIHAMQIAAERFIGLHDFRNFCKQDPARQISNFTRRMFNVSIQEAWNGSLGLEWVQENAVTPLTIPNARNASVYYFEFFGSAFLWHQVRCMVSVLFLIGQGLEDSSVIDELLDVNKNPGKPLYEMADDHPLVLYNCGYPESTDPPYDPTTDGGLQWITPWDDRDATKRKGAFSSAGDGLYGRGGLYEVLWEDFYRKKMDEILSNQLMDSMAFQPFYRGTDWKRKGDLAEAEARLNGRKQSVRVFDGGPALKNVWDYVPVLERGRIEEPEVLNKRWLERKKAEKGESVDEEVKEGAKDE